MSSCQLKFSFSGHETFVFRYGWLKKAVDAIFDDPKTFNGDEAIVTLGLGKNMVKSLRHWSLATRMLEEEGKKNGGALRPTDLGMFLLGPQGADPYLEDPNTLWILHWNLLSNRDRCTTWFWVFNLISSNEFTR